MILLWFFFFKQKTAYEMRISDWSSDVCSSDLRRGPPRMPKPATKPDGVAERGEEDDIPAVSGSPDASLTQDDSFTATSHAGLTYPWGEIGRASGRERVCQYV